MADDEKGWIKLHRKVQENPMYKELNSKQRDIFIQILLMANHEANKWVFEGKEYEVKAGQFITSLDKIKEKCAKDVSIKNIRTALVNLEKYGFLANKSTNKNRLITVVNWDLYQSYEKKRQANQQATGKQPATNKNDKNDKEDIYSAMHYDELWSLYPRKKGKAEFMKKVPKILNEVGFENLKQSIINLTEDTKGKEDKYIIIGSTFINGRYVDYLPANYEKEKAGANDPAEDLSSWY